MLEQSQLSIITIVLYIVCLILILRSPSQYMISGAEYYQRHYLFVATLALIAHGFSLSRIVFIDGGINFGFYITVSMVLFVVVAVLILSALTKPVDKIGLLVFPLAAASLLLTQFFPEQSHILRNFTIGMQIHILTSIIAFSVLSIAATQALLVALQEHQLRVHQPNRFMRSLPPLQVMEHFLFELIGAGFLLLTVSLMTGLLFVHDLFIQHLVHKTVLSISAWLIFGLLLFGKLFYGWRGKIAIRWTLIGFATLLLAYFGSKMVLELILDKV
ncbi:MAG TPA: phosphohydrolase [Crenotrichaceae bacterium]|nr:phosphohydrolase [Crenotrichaceae bacterium]